MIENLFFRYTPQTLTFDYNFKSFIPEYIPAVGDIDAFLKVVVPKTTLTLQMVDKKLLNLGFVGLDEPIANGSDPVLLCLKLHPNTIKTDKKKNKIVVSLSIN